MTSCFCHCFFVSVTAEKKSIGECWCVCHWEEAPNDFTGEEETIMHPCIVYKHKDQKKWEEEDIVKYFERTSVISVQLLRRMWLIYRCGKNTLVQEV